MYKANTYAKSLGAIGGRLLTYEEANNLKDSYSEIIYGTDEATKNYWLGSVDNTERVWGVQGDFGELYSAFIDSDDFYGVRPVIEIYKSEI